MLGFYLTMRIILVNRRLEIRQMFRKIKLRIISTGEWSIRRVCTVITEVFLGKVDQPVLKINAKTSVKRDRFDFILKTKVLCGDSY